MEGRQHQHGQHHHRRWLWGWFFRNTGYITTVPRVARFSVRRRRRRHKHTRLHTRPTIASLRATRFLHYGLRYGEGGIGFFASFFPGYPSEGFDFSQHCFSRYRHRQRTHTQRRTHASMLYTFHQSRGVDGTRNCSFSCVIATGFNTQASLFTLLFDFHDGSNCEILHVESSYNL